MLKLKNLLSEHAWDRKFGEPLPTLKTVAEKHQVTEHTVTFTKDGDADYKKQVLELQSMYKKYVIEMEVKLKQFKRKNT